jgi:DNA polymerase-4
LYLELKSYFASVEKHINPSLRGRLVAVVPSDTDTTCTIAASYEAKDMGIKTGIMIYKAREICPGLVTCPPAMTDMLNITIR